MAGSKPRAVVLLSGGLDSAATLAWAVHRGFDCHALTVDYGQRHAVEIERARRLAAALGAVEHRVERLELDFGGVSSLTDRRRPVPRPSSPAAIGGSIPSTYVPARNTLLLSLALAWAEVIDAAEVLIGANAVDYSGYPDCRPEFLRAFEKLANLATRRGVEGGGFRIRAPLIDAGKADIVRLAAELGVDLGMTVSCYDPTTAGAPCTRCEACLLRARGFAEAGMADPALTAPTPRKD